MFAVPGAQIHEVTSGATIDVACASQRYSASEIVESLSDASSGRSPRDADLTRRPCGA
jgi:hypothetical protein